MEIIKNGQPKNLALHGLKVEMIKNGQPKNLALHGLIKNGQPNLVGKPSLVGQPQQPLQLHGQPLQPHGQPDEVLNMGSDMPLKLLKNGQEI